MEKNLTSGGVLQNIVRFSLPYLLSYFLQTLYGMADLFIIGQFSGTADITAVSIGSQVMHMLTVMIVGLAMGATITIGRAVGGEEHERAALAVGNSATLFMAVSLVLTAVLLVLVRPIAAVMSTPAEAVEGTVQYLTICFVGIPFITAYNIISSIFRGLGDSTSPMYFVAVACAANIGLDYLFIGGMGMGPAGAALGTTLSQTSAGRVYSGLLHPHHHHRQQPRPQRRRGRRHRRKGHQLCLSGALLDAVHRLGAGGAERRRRQGRAGGADFALCRHPLPRLWAGGGGGGAAAGGEHRGRL